MGRAKKETVEAERHVALTPNEEKALRHLLDASIREQKKRPAKDRCKEC